MHKLFKCFMTFTLVCMSLIGMHIYRNVTPTYLESRKNEQTTDTATQNNHLINGFLLHENTKTNININSKSDEQRKTTSSKTKTVNKLSQHKFHTYIPSIPVGSAPPKIPHIIHQTWDDKNVPTMFSKYIQSWKKLHPTWEYWFWTPVEVKKMLETHYPEYTKLYANYTEEIFKANLMRYFIMHQYGGVYADLDLESLRPMDNWTMDNDCVLTENHHVHAFILKKNKKHADIMITMLASRPRHPYFQLAIEMLPLYKEMPYSDKLLYADQVYLKYIKTKESINPGGGVFVAHPDYFLPTYDKGWIGNVQRTCNPRNVAKLDEYQRETCDGVNDGTRGRSPKSFSYANHYWEHVIMWGKTKSQKERTNIANIVPSVIYPKI